MTGYEKSPDYGSPPPKGFWSEATFLAFVFIIFVGTPIAWFYVNKATVPTNCWTLGADEIEYKVIDGQRKATLQLGRIPKGECVTIKP